MASSSARTPRFVLVMGVSGCGKSTVAAALAHALGGVMIEGDSLHPPENIAAMRAGQPLDDAMRLPWLRAVAAAALDEGRHTSGPVVIACSALKQSYRDLLREDLPGLVPVHLHGSTDLLRRRMEDRKGHFMPASLLDSQIAALEPPGPDEGAITVDIADPPDRILSRVLHRLLPAKSAGFSPKG